MMKLRIGILFVVVFSLLFTNLSPVLADGIIIPEPRPCNDDGCGLLRQLDIKYHHVDVNIHEQIAVTHVEQIFYNPNDWPVEGQYIFPIPLNATIDEFNLWDNGKQIKGKILDADTAKEIYQESIRELKDPALFEYIDRGIFQASIYPISPGEERKIEIEYSQILLGDQGLIAYEYPLNTEKFSKIPIEDVSIVIDVESSTPIRAIYSPTHNVNINKIDEHSFKVNYKEMDTLPDKDFTLIYSIGKSEAIHLFTYKNLPIDNTGDGYFMLLLAPGMDEVETQVEKDVLFVLDRSGSMDGIKFNQAKRALKYVLSNLNEGDRFYITSFSSDVDSYTENLRGLEDLDNAFRWIENLSAAGSTDINRALLETINVVDTNRPTYMIFLTDGLPTEGVTDSELILNNVESVLKTNVRLFNFGVGYDVDTYLLDMLSDENRGKSTYIKPDEDIDEIISAFYEQIKAPVLTDITLDFGDQTVYDVYPKEVPDLFSGSQELIVGRYKDSGNFDIRLEGMTSSGLKQINFKDQYFSGREDYSNTVVKDLPRLWATRKIGTLLKEIRLKGPNQEIIDQIIDLSLLYGIVTPYTSFLASETIPLGGGDREEFSADVYSNILNTPAAPSWGKEAVERAEAQNELSDAEIVSQPVDEETYQFRVAGEKTFVYSDGYWVDVLYESDTMDLVEIAYLSADYFMFAEYFPFIGKALALDKYVIVVLDGVAYKIVDEDKNVPPLIIPESIDDVSMKENQVSDGLLISEVNKEKDIYVNILAKGWFKELIGEIYLWFEGVLNNFI